MTDTINEAAHSKRGPSTAHRWIECPASVQASEGLPDDAGIDAAIGTVFHEFAAICLELGVDPQGFVGDTFEVEGFGRLPFTQTMADDMLNGLDLFGSIIDSPGTVTLVEVKMPLDEWVGENEVGTTDLAVIDVLNKRITIGDWKYGMVGVGPEENPQAILYFLAVWSNYARDMFRESLIEEVGAENFEWADALGAPWEEEIEVVIIIEQPRAPGGGGVWTTNVGHLLERGRKIKAAADLTLSPNPPYNPGEKQCQYCPAAKHGKCTARRDYLLGMAQLDFDELEDDFRRGLPTVVPSADAFSPEGRSQLLLHRGQIENMIKDLADSAKRDAARDPDLVPGMKLVSGRNEGRKWKDEDKAEIILTAKLKDDAHIRKLLTPSQVEGIVGKKRFQIEYGRQVAAQGKTADLLVPEHDKRPAVSPLSDDFDEIETGDLI